MCFSPGVGGGEGFLACVAETGVLRRGGSGGGAEAAALGVEAFASVP